MAGKKWTPGAPERSRKLKPKEGRHLPRAGRDGTALAARDAAFVEAYLRNGHNATKAAEAIGTENGEPKAAGYYMLHKPAVQALLAERARAVAVKADLSIGRWADALTAVAFSDPADLLGPDGKMMTLAELPPRVRASISSVKVSADGSVEYRIEDRMKALDMIARHLGLFEKDNQQQQPNVMVKVELVG